MSEVTHTFLPTQLCHRSKLDTIAEVSILIVMSLQQDVVLKSQDFHSFDAYQYHHWVLEGEKSCSTILLSESGIALDRCVWLVSRTLESLAGGQN